MKAFTCVKEHFFGSGDGWGGGGAADETRGGDSDGSEGGHVLPCLYTFRRPEPV